MHPRYRSAVNRYVAPAHAGEFATLRIGPLRVWPPVVLAPMAGVTNPPFRALCRRFGAGLYVSEMITARALVERNEKTLRLASFAENERPRSLQLYGVDPRYVGEAVAFLVGEGRIDHLDMNFGCPVRKVTVRGGGAALPLKPRLLRQIVRAAVRHAGSVPVTIKFRVGVDTGLETYLEAGRIAEGEGCAAVGLHARTAAQLYDGPADWGTIALLKQSISIPVLGNGDVWEAEDALRMMRTTGCAGVIVGRGCLGRPWLFRDLADVFDGREPSDPPNLGEVVHVMLGHAQLLSEWLGEAGAMREFRKHSSWYTKGFAGGAALRQRLMHVGSLQSLREATDAVDRDRPFPPEAMRVRRGKTSGRQRVALPEGYLDNLEDAIPPASEVTVSGG